MSSPQRNNLISSKSKENILLDQTIFYVDPITFDRFQVLLDEPLPPTLKLRRLLKAKTLE